MVRMGESARWLVVLAGLNNMVFTIYSPSNSGHLAPSTIDNVGMILFSETLNMNITNTTLLIVRYLIMSRYYAFVLCACPCIL